MALTVPEAPTERSDADHIRIFGDNVGNPPLEALTMALKDIDWAESVTTCNQPGVLLRQETFGHNEIQP